MRTRIKICGLSSLDHALFAETLGVDAIGLVFVPESPRYLSLDAAAAIASATGPFMQTVGLFANASEDKVIEALAKVELDILQFHGDEKVDYCESFGLPIKAVRVRNAEDIIAADRQYTNASALLLDSYSEKALGGTGEIFDWSLIPQIDRPLILAGGLTVENVGESIKSATPYAVDVSSGVESTPGAKDPAKMRAFVEQVR